jgi:hypothetical protein
MAPILIHQFVVLPDTSIVFEEKETGILQRYCVKNKQLMGFQCKELDSLHTSTFSGLCVSGPFLYHARGGKIKKYDVCSSSKPRAHLLDDASDTTELASFCLHKGELYFTSQSKLFKVGLRGKSQPIPIDFNFTCMASSKWGLLLCGATGLQFLNPDSGELGEFLHINLQDPKQVIEHNSDLYILEKRGICKLSGLRPVLYCMSTIVCIALYSNRLLYLRNNKICFLESGLEMNEDLC